MRALALVALLSAPAAAEEHVVVVVYDGYGTPGSFTVGGRVLEEHGERHASRTASGLANVVGTLEALDSDEVRGADVTVDVAGRSFHAVTDGDGVFRVTAAGLAGKERMPAGALPVHVRASKGTPARALAGGDGVVTIVDGPFVGLVSDVDDTVVKTYVTDKKRMLGAVFLKNGAQSEPVGGAADNYAAAAAAGVKLFLYVSGSPQNFHDRIHTFLKGHGFPLGPLLLKNIGEDPLFDQLHYKIERIEGLLAALPAMRVILVGDSGEKDPEVYAEIRRRHPERVVAVVIREVAHSDVGAARFPNMILVDDAYAGGDVIAGLLRPAPAP